MIDLHLHLDGSIRPECALRMAEMSGVTLTDSMDELKKKLTVEEDCTNLGEYLEKFELPLQLLQTKECISYAVYELLRDLSAEGLCYAEIRLAPQLHCQRGLSQRQVLSAAVEGLCKGTEEFKMPAQLILCCMRGEENRQENLETVEVAKEFLHQGVCALDLAGNEAAYPTQLFAELFEKAAKEEIPFTIHAGEAAGPESMKAALSFGAKRIGHGIHAMEDTQLMHKLAEQGTFLEMCYVSNLQTKTVDTPEQYPLPIFLKKGIRITVNTDNRTVSDTTLKKEYRSLQKQFGLSDETLREIACNAADAAFVTDELRGKLKQKIADEFLAWIR